MGIPGLQRDALVKGKLHGRRFFEGGDFYLDGLNFAHRISGRSDSSGTQERARDGKKASKRIEEPHARAARLTNKIIGALRKLKPRSITLVLDAFVSEEKFKIRISRSNMRLRKGDAPYKVSGIFTETVLASHPDINVIYAGTEAEDEIMKLIDEDPHRGRRRQFVFSDDSDLFRFYISRPKSVEIVPLVGRTLYTGTLFTINLADVLSARIVPRSAKIVPPILRPGVSTINPKNAGSTMLMLKNSGIAYNRFFLSMSTIIVPHMHELGIEDPYQAGEEVRRASYGLMIRDSFQGNPVLSIASVEEWRQIGLSMVPVKVFPFAGDELDQALKVLRVAPIETIVGNQLHQVEDVFDLSANDIEAATAMIHDVLEGKGRKPSRDVNKKAFRIFMLLQAIFISIQVHGQAVGTPLMARPLAHITSAQLLESYLDVNYTDGEVPTVKRTRASTRKTNSSLAASSSSARSSPTPSGPSSVLTTPSSPLTSEHPSPALVNSVLPEKIERSDSPSSQLPANAAAVNSRRQQPPAGNPQRHIKSKRFNTPSKSIMESKHQEPSSQASASPSPASKPASLPKSRPRQNPRAGNTSRSQSSVETTTVHAKDTVSTTPEYTYGDNELHRLPDYLQKLLLSEANN